MKEWPATLFETESPWATIVEHLPKVLEQNRRYVMLESRLLAKDDVAVICSGGRWSKYLLQKLSNQELSFGKPEMVDDIVALRCKGPECQLTFAVEPKGAEDKHMVQLAEIAPVLAGAFNEYCWRRRCLAATDREASRYRTISLLYELSRQLDPQQPVAFLARTVLANLYPLVPYDVAGILITVDPRGSLTIQPRATMQSGVISRFRDILLSEFTSYSMGPTIDDIEENVMPAVEPNPMAVDDQTPLRSQLSVPLILRGGVFAGHILLGSFTSDISASTHFQMLSTIVNHFNSVLTNRKLLSELEKQAKMDEMTGVFNYRTFRNVLEREVGRAKRYKKPLSLLMVDVDHFKSVNDTYGHQKGDLVLQGVARMLNESKREVDTVARYGGEEFAMILPETVLDGAVQMGERMRNMIKEATFIEGREITISVGVATLDCEDISSDRLIGSADKALYCAKNGGRDRVYASIEEGK